MYDRPFELMTDEEHLVLLFYEESLAGRWYESHFFYLDVVTHVFHIDLAANLMARSDVSLQMLCFVS